MTEKKQTANYSAEVRERAGLSICDALSELGWKGLRELTAYLHNRQMSVSAETCPGMAILNGMRLR